MPTLRQNRYNWLRRSGLLPFEASQLANSYSMTQLRSTPYIQDLMRSRRLEVANLRSRGYSDNRIRLTLLRQYVVRGWWSHDEPDIWANIRRLRKQAIDSGEYIPIPRKKVPGSHHAIKRRDLDQQKQRRNRRISDLERYARGRGRE